MIEQGTRAVQSPIGAPALGGAIAVILVYALHDGAGLEFGPEVSVAITTVITYITQRVIRRMG